jgi:hypothetical protein
MINVGKSQKRRKSTFVERSRVSGELDVAVQVCLGRTHPSAGVAPGSILRNSFDRN